MKPEAIASAPTAVAANKDQSGQKSQAEKDQEKIDRFDLPNGTMMEAAQKKHLNQKAFAPDQKMLQPYANASVGPRIAYSIVGYMHIARAPAAQKIAQDTIERLLASWEGPHPDIEIAIEARSGYAAKSTEQGVMLVPLGAFDPDPKKGVASQDELALLLGHELAHYLLHHIDRKATRKAIVDKLAMAASGWITYGAVKNTTMTDGKMTVAADKATVQRAHMVGLAATMLIGDLLNPGFDRHNEYEADLLAIDLAIKAGFNISQSEVDNFITRHTADDTEKSNRMMQLQAIVQLGAIQLGMKAGQKTGKPLGIDFGAMLSAASAQMIGKIFDELAKSMKPHPDPAVRLGIMKRYFAAHYATKGDDEQLVHKDTRQIRDLAKSGAVSPVLDGLKRAEKEYLALALNDPKDNGANKNDSSIAAKAVKMADAQVSAGTKAAAALPKDGAENTQKKSRSGSRKKMGRDLAAALRPPARVPLGSNAESYGWYVEGEVQSIQLANRAEAHKAWLRSADADYPSLDGARNLANDYADSDMRDRVLPIVDHVGRVLGTTDPVMDIAVGAAMARGDMAGAEVLAARCLTFDGGRLYAFCTQELGYDPLQKDVGAKTPEGQKAFAGKSLEKQFSFFSTIGSLFK